MISINGHIVREMREAIGLKQTALAHRAGVSQSLISQAENNKRQISKVSVEKIAKALFTKVEYLTGVSVLESDIEYLEKKLPKLKYTSVYTTWKRIKERLGVI